MITPSSFLKARLLGAPPFPAAIDLRTEQSPASTLATQGESDGFTDCVVVTGSGQHVSSTARQLLNLLCNGAIGLPVGEAKSGQTGPFFLVDTTISKLSPSPQPWSESSGGRHLTVRGT